MSYRDTSKIRVCKVLEDNYPTILNEFQEFNFDISVDNGYDANWELWDRDNNYTVKQAEKDNTPDTDWDNVDIQPYKRSHSWYGLNVDGESIWDGVVLAVRDKVSLNSTPIIENFFSQTFNLLKSYKEITSVAIARFPAGRIIPLHRGYPMLIRIHMGLIVPEGDIGFCVKGEKRKWENGKCLAFNDSSEHTAWNNTEVDRINLIVDVLR